MACSLLRGRYECLDSYASYSHGLCSHGLYSHGSYSHGLDSHGLDRYGLDSYGLFFAAGQVRVPSAAVQGTFRYRLCARPR